VTWISIPSRCSRCVTGAGTSSVRSESLSSTLIHTREIREFSN
jgi:hypothetical protein